MADASRCGSILVVGMRSAAFPVPPTRHDAARPGPGGGDRFQGTSGDHEARRGDSKRTTSRRPGCEATILNLAQPDYTKA